MKGLGPVLNKCIDWKHIAPSLTISPMNVRLTDDGFFSSFQWRSWSASSQYVSLLQTIVVWWPWLRARRYCLHIFPKTNDSRWSLCLLVCVLGHFPSLGHVQGSTSTGVFVAGCQTLSVWNSHSIFWCKLIESVMVVACVWSDCHFLRQSAEATCTCFHLHCQALFAWALQLAYFQYWSLCLTHTRRAGCPVPVSVLFCLSRLHASSRLGRFCFVYFLFFYFLFFFCFLFISTEWYALNCSTFCLVCTGGRSSMNLVVSVGVCLVVPSTTRIACSALCPASAALSVTLSWGLVHSQWHWEPFPDTAHDFNTVQ